MAESLKDDRVGRCVARALAVGWTADGGNVRDRAWELAKLPAGGWPETKQARAALRDAVACAVSGDDSRFMPDEIEAACDRLVRDPGRYVYVVIAAPGHYTSMQSVSAVRTYYDREGALDYARRRSGLAVIRVDLQTQSPPWVGHDLDRLHREQSVS